MSGNKCPLRFLAGPTLLAKWGLDENGVPLRLREAGTPPKDSDATWSMLALLD